VIVTLESCDSRAPESFGCILVLAHEDQFHVLDNESLDFCWDKYRECFYLSAPKEGRK
jgi:hypothetical protein